MKKILICFLLAATALFLFAGCSNVSTLPAEVPVPSGEKKVQEVPAESEEKEEASDPKNFSDIKLLEEKSGNYKAED